MYRYKLLNNEIAAMQQFEIITETVIENEEEKTVQVENVLQSYAKGLLSYDELEWQETEQEIIVCNGKLLFADSEECRQAKIQEQLETVKANLLSSVDRYLNETVQARGYDSILSACSYAFAEADQTFKAEGQKALEWRSLVYRKCYDIMAEVEAGEREIPSEEELLAELPVLEW